MCTIPLCCTGALYTFSHTVSTNQRAGVAEEAAPHLEYVKRLELYALRLVAEQVHHQAQVAHVANVPHHRAHVGAVEQQLPEEQGLVSPD